MVNIAGSFYQAHPFHLVSLSPWPLYTCISLFTFTSCFVLTIHGFHYAIYFFTLGVFSLISSMSFWFRDIISEATFLGNHTSAVQKGLIIGLFLFLISETLFFLVIFWAYFHSGLSPTLELGAQWPPLGVKPVNAFELPLLNTILLLISGVTITNCHHSLIQSNRSASLAGLFFTLILATIFTMFQILEYYISPFTISDGNYGSCFYFGTGFHGLHVIIGTIFLVTGLLRLTKYHLSVCHHLGLLCGILYWHFVDVIWIFLFISFYFWGS